MPSNQMRKLNHVEDCEPPIAIWLYWATVLILDADRLGLVMLAGTCFWIPVAVLVIERIPATQRPHASQCEAHPLPF